MDTHLIFVIMMYAIFAVISSTMVVYKIWKNGTIRIINLSEVLYILIVVIAPTIVFFAHMNDGFASSVKYDNKYVWTFYLGVVCTIVGYFSLEFGYRIKQKEFRIKESNCEPKFLLTASVFMVISVVSLILWASGFGGVSQLILNANSIRASFISSSGNTAFFKHFVPLSMLASFLMFYYLFINKIVESTSKKIYAFILFVFSAVISFVFILANDGRMLAGIYIFLFCLLIVKNDYEVKKKQLSGIIFRLLILMIITILIILSSDAFFSLIRGKTLLTVDNTDNGFFVTLAKEFNFIPTGLQQAIIYHSGGTTSLMIGNDIINGVFAWLPTSLKPVLLTDVWDFNTSLINSGGYGQSPTSIVAQSVYDLGYFGVFVVPAIYGFIIRRVEKYLDSYEDNMFAATVYVVVGFYLAKGIAYFSFYNIMMNIFFIVLGCTIYWCIHRVTIGRR